VAENETPRGWLAEHPKKALCLAWASCLAGAALVFFGAGVAADDFADGWDTCVTTVVEEAEPPATPGDKPVVESIETTTTCRPAGLTGAPAVPILAGLILCLPGIRLLTRGLKLTLPWFGVEDSQPAAREITETEATENAEWQSPILARLDELAIQVEQAADAKKARQGWLPW
jgi:hypothetical protein